MLFSEKIENPSVESKALDEQFPEGDPDGPCDKKGIPMPFTNSKGKLIYREGGITEPQRNLVYGKSKGANISDDEVRNLCMKAYNVNEYHQLDWKQHKNLIERLDALTKGDSKALYPEWKDSYQRQKAGAR